MSDIKGNQTVIKLSVRSLVEFILRTGDIDDRHPGSVSEKAMQEGSRIHRLLQGRAGAGYSAEVPLSITVPADLYDIYIEGRADGIIDDSLQGPASLMSKQLSLNQYLTSEEYSQITVDEIKCVRKKLSKMKAPVPVHLAQAKVYAYIYALDHKLPLIRVRMTYCDPRTEDLKYFFEEYTFEELREWFDGVIKEFRRFADMRIEWEQIRNKSALELEFPFEYRKGQKKLVSYVRQTIAEGKKLYLEAPTGTGKTLITLFPSVKAFGAGLSGKVFYLTGKNVTGTVAENALSQMREAGLKIKGITLTAKDKICILPQRECNPEKCPYAKGHFDRINEALFAILNEQEIFSREIIEKYAEKYGYSFEEITSIKGDVNLDGEVTAADFGKYTASGAVADTLNSTLSRHIQKLNLIRRAIPALRRGQYSTEGINGNMAYKRRYTNGNTDSFVCVTISGGATFTGIPNGDYVDAVTGDKITVSDNTLDVKCEGKANMRVYVLNGPGQIGGDVEDDYLK